MNLNRQMINSVEGENAFIHHPKAVKRFNLRELKKKKMKILRTAERIQVSLEKLKSSLIFMHVDFIY